ncbi:MAG: ABC transporter substrate-binding protein [Opitutales bacterium]
MRSLLVLALACLGAVSDAAERIASFSPAATRILVDLGVGDGIVAATRWCELPASHAARRSCDAFEPDMEALRASGASVAVLPRLSNPMLAERVRSIGLRVVVLTPESPESPAADIATLARLTGRIQAAESLLRARTQAQRSRGNKRVLVIWDGVCAGPDSYLSWAIRAAGGEPAPMSGAWPQWDIEEMARASPDLVLLLKSDGPPQPTEDSQELDFWTRTAGLRNTPAAKNMRVFKVKAGSDWLPASGQPAAAETLARLLEK